MHPEAEDILNLKYGVAGVCVMFTILILFEVAKLVWSMSQKRTAASETTVKANTQAIQDLLFEIRCLDKRLAVVETGLKKFDLDARRFYAGMKLIAGPDRWKEISDALQKDISI